MKIWESIAFGKESKIIILIPEHFTEGGFHVVLWG